MLTRPVHIPVAPGGLPSLSGNALRRLRVNEAGTAAEWANDSTEIINVEEARSDIRSTTRAGYSGFDSQPGLQALLDAMGPNKALKLPVNGVLNLNGKMIKTKAEGQSIVSEGFGAELSNGGVEVNNRMVNLENFRITGTGTHGILITDPSLANAYAYPTQPEMFTSQLRVSKVYIWNKTYGVYNAVAGLWNRFFDVRTWYCDTGVYIDHSDTLNDSGDWHFTHCRFQKATTGMKIVKLGGLVLTDTKFHHCSSGGLLLETPATRVGTYGSNIQGTYIANCEFEDAGSGSGWDIKITSLGTDPLNYPRWTQIVSGTAMRIWLNKCKHTSMEGVLSNVTLQLDTTSYFTEIFGSPFVSLTGAGADYVVFGNDAADGPIVRTGKRLRIIDQDGSAYVGSYLTSIAAAPAYIGQRALFNGGWYFAKGTTGPSDWVGTGGGIDGGLFTDTYTISGIDGGSF